MKKLSKQNAIPKHRKAIYFSLFSSMLILTFFSLQSCEEATLVEANQQESTLTSISKTSAIELDELDLFAKQLAVTLKSNELKDVLINNIQRTNTREFILDAKSLVEKEINLLDNSRTTLKNEILNNTTNSNKKNVLSNVFEKLKEGKIDIYFPLFEHFTNWTKNKSDLKVGYINPKKEWDPINTYSTNGEHSLLDAHKPPAEPVLMVNYCEHFGNHTDDFKFDEKNTKQLKKANFTPEFLDEVKITVCEEPWGSGVPEIMVRIKNKYDTVVRYLAMQSGGNSFFNCGCCGFLCLGMCHDYNWKTPYDFWAYVWTPDHYYYIWEWWENDQGDDWEEKEENDPYDDDLGIIAVYKSDAYSKQYNTGHMLFKVSNTP